MSKSIDLNNYSVRFGSIRTALEGFLTERTYTRVAVLVDEHTAVHCWPLIAPICDGAHIIKIPAGEEHKSIDTCTKIWSDMVESGMDRHSLLINLGGGVIGDMGGFAASCFMRGIDFIQVPTTLLSQVDASVGGKLAVDFIGLKNLIGLFQDPKSVLVDWLADKSHYQP